MPNGRKRYSNSLLATLNTRESAKHLMTMTSDTMPESFGMNLQLSTTQRRSVNSTSWVKNYTDFVSGTKSSVQLSSHHRLSQDHTNIEGGKIGTGEAL